jgi:hypothetical protein
MTRDDLPAVVAILLVGAYAGFVAVCAFRRALLPHGNQASEYRTDAAPDQKAAFDLLAAYLREYESYGRRKENMAWLVATLGIGAGAAAVFRGDELSKLKQWSDVAFWPFFSLCLATAVAVLLLLRFQNVSRHQADALSDAAANTYVHWLAQAPRIPQDELMPTLRFDNPRHEVPAGLARRYADLMARPGPSVLEQIGYLIVGGWGLAALLKIVWARFAS